MNFFTKFTELKKKKSTETITSRLNNYLFPKCFRGIFIMLLTSIDNNKKQHFDFGIV